MKNKQTTANILRVASLILAYVVGALIGQGSEALIQKHILDE